MSQHTPDAWIERHWLDEPVDPSYNPCAEGECLHYHCDICSRIMSAATESGCCVFCEMEYLAQHQLTFPGNGKLPVPVLADAATKGARNPIGGEARDSTDTKLERPVEQVASGTRGGQIFQPIGIAAVLEHFHRRFGINE